MEYNITHCPLVISIQVRQVWNLLTTFSITLLINDIGIAAT